MGARRSLGLQLVALGAAVLGVLLLLSNFYLITDFQITALLPLLLVAAGAAVLVRGDLLGGTAGRTFGITRGSVEAGVLEVSAGAIDVRIAALPREGRLIAGQFAPDARPQLTADEGRAVLRFDRAATPFLAFAPWELGLARDLPWTVFASTSLGNLDLDLRGLIVDGGLIATGIGDIRMFAPGEAFAPLTVRSALGSVQILVPDGCAAEIVVSPGRFVRVHRDSARYSESSPGVYTRNTDATGGRAHIVVWCGFGDVYLA